MLFTFPSRYLFTIGRQRVFSLARWSARIHTKLHLCRVTQEFPRRARIFGYGSLTLFGAIFQSLHLSVALPHRAPTTPGASSGFGLFRFRSPLLTESFHFLFLRLLRCFTSPGVASLRLSPEDRLNLQALAQGQSSIASIGLPHSEIHGSKRICRSP